MAPVLDPTDERGWETARRVSRHRAHPRLYRKQRQLRVETGNIIENKNVSRRSRVLFAQVGSGAVWLSCSAIYLSRHAMDDQSSPQGNNIISRG
jgi:hypothetical protein